MRIAGLGRRTRLSPRVLACVGALTFTLLVPVLALARPVTHQTHAAGSHRAVATVPANATLRGSRDTTDLATATLYSAVVTGRTISGTYVTASLAERCLPSSQLGWGDGRAGPSGHYTLTLASGGVPVRAEPGQRVLLAVADRPVQGICMPDLSASADADLDTVYGVAPPGAPVTVTVFAADGRPITQSVHADDAAGFRARFGGRHDITSDSTGLATVSGGDGTRVSLRWAVPRAALVIDEATVTGWGAPGRVVRLSLLRGGQTVSTAEGVADDQHADPDRGGAGRWSLRLRDAVGAATRVQAGDTLWVTVGDDRVNVEVPRITADVDAVADAVSGVAPPGRPVAIDLRRGDVTDSVTVTTGIDGFYTASLEGRWDIRSGDDIAVIVALEHGHTVRTSATESGLTALLDTGQVHGLASPGSAVSATLRADSGALRASGRTSASGSGRFELELVAADGQPVLPDPGDVLGVRYAGSVVTMTMPVFSVRHDLGADTVTGEASPGGEVIVRVFSDTTDGRREWVLSAGRRPGGGYTADFRGLLDISAGTRLEILQHTDEGHVARLDRRVPEMHLQHGGNRLAGFVAPRARVTARLWRVTATLGTRSTVAANDGAFDLHFVDGTGDPIALSADDRVDVSWTGGALRPPDDSGDLSVSVLPVTATIDAGARLLSGRAPAKAAVRLRVHLNEGGSPAVDLVALADASGAFSTTLDVGQRPGPLRAGLWSEVGVRGPDGHRSYVLAVVPYLELYVGRPEIEGRVGPLANAELTLSEADTVIASATVTGDTLGAFGTVLRPLAGDVAFVRSGQRLALELGAGAVAAIEVPPLTVRIDQVGRALRGTAPANQAVVVETFVPLRPLTSVETQADSEGVWVVEERSLPAGVTIADVVEVTAAIAFDNGHRLAARALPGAATATPTVTATESPTPTESPETTPIASPSPSATASPTPTAEVATPTGTSPAPTATGTPAEPRPVFVPVAQRGAVEARPSP